MTFTRHQCRSLRTLFKKKTSMPNTTFTHNSVPSFTKLKPKSFSKRKINQNITKYSNKLPFHFSISSKNQSDLKLPPTVTRAIQLNPDPLLRTLFKRRTSQNSIPSSSSLNKPKITEGILQPIEPVVLSEKKKKTLRNSPVSRSKSI